MAETFRDAAARTRIVTELDRSLIVEAGAGSGKTHEMAARMAAGVASGVYALEHIAAVTFTRKAAAELRGRFHLALEAELKQADEPSRRARIDDAIANLERFFAGTIHSFCARLLRERPIEAEVSPGFVELDEVDDKLLRMQSWRDYRAQARAAGDPDLALLAEAGIHAPDLDKAFETICLYEDVGFPAADVPSPDDAPVWEKVAEFWVEIERYLPDPIADDTTCETQKAAVDFRRDWRFAKERLRTPARMAELLEHWDFDPKITQNRWADDTATKKKINGIIPPLHEAFRDGVVTPYLRQWREHLYAPAVRILTKARDHAADERRRRNVLSFNDLLLLTARVLREDASVRAALQDKYRHLFVDEFQDTDPVQAEIMLLLATGGGPQAAARTLFVVGDPKQSIYRFRRADITIYNEVRAHLGRPDGSGVVSLTTNFRSVPDVCDWANRVFEQTFPAKPDEWQPQYAPLMPNRTGGAGPAVCTLTVPAAVGRAAQVVEFEADAIARYIRDEVDRGRRRYQDFMVLTRKKKGLQVYARALEHLQIPVEVSGGGGFGDSPEVVALSELLIALADPQDSVALVGVLRGLFFGLSDPQLFAYRQAGGYLGLFSEIDAPPAAAAPVAQALESLRRWYKWTRMLPAGAALDRILEDSGALALAAATPGGVEAGDLLHAIDRVRAAVEVGLTLSEAAEALTDETLETSDVESLPLEPGRPDVVRLMNLHKAKGLEAAVVFLADPMGGFSPRVDIHVVRPPASSEAGPSAIGYLPVAKKIGEHYSKVLAQPIDWEIHEAAEQQFLDAEVNRLLYVAATRAKDMLVVGRWAKSGGKAGSRAWDVFEPYLAGVPELVVPAGAAAPSATVVDLSGTAVRAAGRAAETAHEYARQPTWAATSVTAELKRLPRFALEGSDAATAAAITTEPGDPTRTILPDTPSHRADAGQAWGTLVHGLLEHAMRHQAATSSDLHRLAMWLTVDEPQLRDVIDRAVETALAVVASDALATARGAAERHEEVPFAMLDTRNGVPTVVSGAIDLVHRTDDGWQVVDYKTDADAPGVGTNAAYEQQVTEYAGAWERVTGQETGKAIVSARKA
jgi:ATP-dependent helicase/nuclease subunit A